MSNINPGDLVIVYRVTHSCQIGLIGLVRRIKKIDNRGVGFYCEKCGERDIAIGEAAAQSSGGRKNGGIPVSWLKKIDPPATGETEGAYLFDKEPA